MVENNGGRYWTSLEFLEVKLDVSRLEIPIVGAEQE